MAKSIINYKNSKNEELVVVPNDGGFVQSLSDQILDGLVTQDTITSLLDFLFWENNYLTTSNLSDISDTIKNDIVSMAEDNDIETEVDGMHIDSSGFQNGHEYDDIEILSVEDLTIDFKNAYVVDADKDSNFLEIEVEARMVVNISVNFIDEEKSYWDSEEKSYISIHYGKAIEKHEVPFICRLSAQYNGKNFICQSVGYNLDLNYYTLVQVDYS